MATGWLFAALNICSVTYPQMCRLAVFTTLAEKSMVSPSRRKRGAFGTTITSLAVCTNFSKRPVIKAGLWATPCIFHLVRASGMVKLRKTVPSGSVRNCG